MPAGATLASSAGRGGVNSPMAARHAKNRSRYLFIMDVTSSPATLGAGELPPQEMPIGLLHSLASERDRVSSAVPDATSAGCCADEIWGGLHLTWHTTRDSTGKSRRWLGSFARYRPEQPGGEAKSV